MGQMLYTDKYRYAGSKCLHQEYSSAGPSGKRQKTHKHKKLYGNLYGTLEACECHETLLYSSRSRMLNSQVVAPRKVYEQSI